MWPGAPPDARPPFSATPPRPRRRTGALITEALTRDVPGSTVMGEELSPHVAAAGEVAWIVDPLDGTTNYLHGYPQYAVSIACALRGTLRIGVETAYCGY